MITDKTMHFPGTCFMNSESKTRSLILRWDLYSEQAGQNPFYNKLLTWGYILRRNEQRTEKHETGVSQMSGKAIRTNGWNEYWSSPNATFPHFLFLITLKLAVWATAVGSNRSWGCVSTAQARSHLNRVRHSLWFWFETPDDPFPVSNEKKNDSESASQ